MDLPFVDRHTFEVAAFPQRVWEAIGPVVAQVVGGRAAGTYARAIACDPPGFSGDFPREGATVPAFRVEHADPPRTLRLAGRHRFALYTLEFSIEPAEGGGSLLSATTHATFPGLAGRLYRAAVIRTGAHAIVTRRMVRNMKRRAEEA